MDALMLPLNWQRVRLGDIGKPCMCKRVMKHQTTRYGEIPFYKIGTFGNTADAFISKKLFLEYKTKYSFPKKGDILISASGTIGRAVIYDGKPAYFQDSNIVWIDNDETLVKNDFLFYVYSHVKWNTEHTTILRLYNDNFRNTLIPLPPLNEQIAIANILSDVDRYLYSLDALILKKESVKKALSFELLSQRKRLKGFNQAWQRVRLGDICYLKNGFSFKSDLFKNMGIPIIRISNISSVDNCINTNDLVFYDPILIDNDYILKQGDLILAMSGATTGKSCLYNLNKIAYLNQRVGVFRAKTSFCYDFLVQFVFSELFTSRLKLILTAGAQPNISSFDIEDFEILLPPLDEQIAIANILSGLDSEIISLKNKKRQFENIKKALNHDLMSAKIRVLKK
ncbi:restriction endonuclease subunit S [Helicobacter pylori]|uniref:restriction endonuclease subunit S n=1 Tax=Helicobacter pylori TaxID=210 RepID=UPI0005745DF8|nr:restriction endonuclease subunit S [Helicobacter pylori]KHL77568.1 restriction endonuclease subunit S [Helicobacter pylori]KHL79831.1 restriction endonuclease subunit S [Helicobacter pylori]